MKGKFALIFGSILVLFLIVAALAFSFGKKNTTGKNYDEFAQCLATRGVTMYGASWCSHCQNQKLQFGDAFRFVNYVECTKEIKLCTDKNIQGFPTWDFNGGERLVGEQSLEKLSAQSGCPLP
jgi:hypothetical protein